MDKLDKKIAIIGVGHIGSSLAKGLLNSGFKKENLILSNSAKNNRKAVSQADWILLAVKPFMVRQVLVEIKDDISNKLLISVAAAISVTSISKYARNGQKIIRIMPNIPVAYNNGLIGLYANKAVSKLDKKEIVNILSLLGLVLEVKREKELDEITLISACGPAIVSQFIEYLSNYGIKRGLSSELSRKLAQQTFRSTISYLDNSAFTPATLIQSVSTKGGISEAILQDMENNQLSSSFNNSMDSGYQKLTKLKESLQ